MSDLTLLRHAADVFQKASTNFQSMRRKPYASEEWDMMRSCIAHHYYLYCLNLSLENHLHDQFTLSEVGNQLFRRSKFLLDESIEQKARALDDDRVAAYRDIYTAWKEFYTNSIQYEVVSGSHQMPSESFFCSFQWRFAGKFGSYLFPIPARNKSIPPKIPPSRPGPVYPPNHPKRD